MTDWQFLAEERSKALGPLMGDLTIAVTRNEELIEENNKLKLALHRILGNLSEMITVEHAACNSSTNCLLCDALCAAHAALGK